MIIIAIILIIFLFSYISTVPCNSEEDEIEELIIADEIFVDDE